MDVHFRMICYEAQLYGPAYGFGLTWSVQARDRECSWRAQKAKALIGFDRVCLGL